MPTRIRLFLLIPVLAGCSSSQLANISMNPFREHEKTRYVTPVKRTAALRELASSAQKQSPEQKQQIMADLTKQIQEEEDPLMRETLLEAIAPYRTPLSMAVLQAGLRDDDPAVRIVAVQQISEHGGQEAVPVLAEVVRSDTDLDVRLAATRKLARFKDRVAIDAVASGLDDSDPAMRHRAMVSLAAMTDENIGLDVRAWREYVQTGVAPARQGPSMAERLHKLRPF